MLALCLSVLLLIAGPAGAESFGKVGFELYSWQTPSGWQYAVLEGTGPVRSVERIKSSGHRLKNSTYLKGRIASLPTGETVFWREDKRRGFLLPPKEVVHDINEYARTAQIQLLLPGQRKSSKAAEEINADFDRLTN